MEIKEIKSIHLVSYTLMNSSVNAVWAFIYAIFSLILALIGLAFDSSAMAWTLIGVYAAMIIASPVSTFLIGIAQSFITALIYNQLVPRIGGIKLGLENLSEVKSVPIIPFALMTSTIAAIMTLLIALIIVPLFAAYAGIFIQLMSSMAASTDTAAISTAGLGAFGAIGSLILIIVMPIAVFIMAFIADAILAGLYNLIAPKVGGIKLEFGNAKEGLHELLIIPPLPVALVTGVLTAVIGFIVGLIMLIIAAASGSALVGVLLLLAFTIGGFIVAFVVDAILALIYNFLRPKIGGVKLQLE
ncbi:hypothetical protein [Methanobacterium sp.]|uniref:hypothetical protein n=1 Tax=Methanobacterium sp. TaxID=2164 RepID=UPI002ABC37D6|nr:hypothetical protein [Methanobacterium sp.]MDY9924206.1 hypothetical protein [Methanobacterium sp.]